MIATDVPVTVGDEAFERIVLQAAQPAAVLFCLDRFAKCRQMEERWAALARSHGERLRVARVDVAAERRWARHFGIERLPTTLWLRDGEVRQQVTGLIGDEEIAERATALLEDREPRLPEPPRGGLDSSGGPVVVTDATFGAVESESRPVLVDFWAPWCGPCRMIAPALESLAGEIGDRAVIAKLNVDENPATAQRFNVMSIPTLLIFRGGRVVDTLVGAQPAPVIRQRLTAHL